MARKSVNTKKQVEKITNKGNWFIVQIIEKLERANVSKRIAGSKRMCTVYGNWHLIKAVNAEKAYTKAEKLGRESSFNFTNSDKEEMRWEFVGIGDLLPVYEDIEDTGELMWTDFGHISLSSARKLIVNKKKHLANIRPVEKRK